MKGDWDEVEEKTRKKGTGGRVGIGKVQGVGRGRVGIGKVQGVGRVRRA